MSPGELESINIIFSNVLQNALNLRIGRFEPAYHAFSSRRSFYLAQPYEIFAFATPRNQFVFEDNQMGIEAAGRLRSGFKYGFGVVNGNGGSPDNNTFKDLYLNLTQTFGKGDGESAGQRFDVFTYFGWQPFAVPGTVISPTGETNGKNNKSFHRWGIDGSLNRGMFNLRGLFMRGVDDKRFNNLQPNKKYVFTGGLAELDWAAMTGNRLIASLLVNWVRPPEYDDGRRVDAYSALVRYYLGDWIAANVALHAEYTLRRLGERNTVNENLFSLAIDFAL